MTNHHTIHSTQTTLPKKLILVISLLLSIAIFLTLKATTSAATINVSAGTDTIAVDSTCHLSEAIENINNQAQTNLDCPAGDGNEDTINLPSGTITLIADLPELEQSITIQGQGMGETVIDGDGAYKVFYTPLAIVNANFVFSGMTIRGYSEMGILLGANSIDVQNVEINGTNAVKGDSSFGPGTYLLGGILLIGTGTEVDTASINNVYVHSISASNAAAVHGITMFGIDHTINNTTVANISADDGAGVAGIVVGPTVTGSPGGTATSEISNVTIDNISGNNMDGVVGIGVEAFAASQDAIITTTITNSTIGNINASDTNEHFDSIFIQTAAVDNSIDAVINIALQNNLLLSGNDGGCTFSDITSSLGATGTPVLNTISNGGNISNSTTCEDWLDNDEDQNNLTNLASTLGSLSDNGGSVPTIPLLPGSPAIDAGVPVVGLTTDARGVTRPQCSAYDSGAYEYNGTCPVAPTNPPLTTPVSNNTTSYLVLPDGITNPVFTTTPDNQITTDPAFSYPAGLVSFQFDTDPGATETVTLYFDLPGSPSSYVARKYNPTTKAFTTIDQATITRETYNNQDLVKLTYPITDGGLLDQDNQINGTIVDPVGLAQQTTNSPNTGLQRHWLLGVNR